MLAELALGLLTPAGRMTRRLVLVSESAALWAWGLRQRKAWPPHHARSRTVVAGVIESLSGRLDPIADFRRTTRSISSSPPTCSRNSPGRSRTGWRATPRQPPCPPMSRDAASPGILRTSRASSARACLISDVETVTRNAAGVTIERFDLMRGVALPASLAGTTGEAPR